MKHKMEKLIGLTLVKWQIGSNGHLAEMKFDNQAELYLNCITKVVPATDDLLDTMLALDCPKIVDASHDNDKGYEIIFENKGMKTTIQFFDLGNDDLSGFIFEEF